MGTTQIGGILLCASEMADDVHRISRGYPLVVYDRCGALLMGGNIGGALSPTRLAVVAHDRPGLLYMPGRRAAVVVSLELAE
jgi:hypothetical protein